MNFQNYLYELVLKTENNKRDELNIERDISIVSMFFGFSDNRYPNGQTVGDEFSVSREYIRQRIQSKVSNAVSESDQSRFEKFLTAVTERDIYTFKDIKDILLNEGFDISDMNAYGFNNFVTYFDINYPYEIFNFEMKKADRKDFYSLDDFLLIKKDKINHFKKILKQVFTLPGHSGLITLSEIFDPKNGMPYEMIKYIIMQYRGSYTYSDGLSLWYTFENRDNVFINSIGKIKSQISNCNIDKLADILHEIVTARTSKYEYPSVRVIRKYLESSVYTDVKGEILYFKENLEIPTLSESDNIIISYFKDRNISEAVYNDLKQMFLLNNYSDANAVKNCYHSPFIFVDKSAGRKNYRLIFVSEFETEDTLVEDKYILYRNKLIKHFNNTDKEINSFRRAEQRILQDYLFKDANELECAICGKKFKTKSLVTAHKKKRSVCNENERIDPRIVWPLCKFGCDYLYEERYIKVNNGKICSERLDELTDSERKYIIDLEGDNISEEWLYKSGQYFE